jgi:hypothetical protein
VVGVLSDSHVETILAASLHHVLVGTNTSSLECLERNER